MEQSVTKTSSRRLLLNAEPFGFGPSAAIASFFPHLRAHFDIIGYVGKRHTLDLQRKLPYDQIHDISAMGKEERASILAPIFAQYDVFLSAMDYKMVAMAQVAGLKVFYYDALAWFWPEIPYAVQQCDFYIAQNFYGVENRLSDLFTNKAQPHVVSPIVPHVTPIENQHRTHVLINLGGLQNPFWPIEDVVAYAQNIIKTLRSIIPENENIIIATSQAVSDQIQDDCVATYSRAKLNHLLAYAKIAFMTPGLGNIYDAAAYDVPAIWLPPTNDSQDRQLRLLESHDMCDFSLNWPHFMSKDTIDYHHGYNQEDVLKKLALRAQSLSNEDNQLLKNMAQQHFHAALKMQHSKSRQLINHFGTGGEQQVAQMVINHA